LEVPRKPSVWTIRLLFRLWTSKTTQALTDQSMWPVIKKFNWEDWSRGFTSKDHSGQQIQPQGISVLIGILITHISRAHRSNHTAPVPAHQTLGNSDSTAFAVVPELTIVRNKHAIWMTQIIVLILGVCILLRVWDRGESVFCLRNFNIVGFYYLFNCATYFGHTTILKYTYFPN
jgi:hypothetical protein